MLHRQPAIDKVRGAVGWSPTRSLDDILAHVIEFVRRAPVAPETAAFEG
jgi:hypothetical protein